jgi:class 3 adenylate cyclase
MSNKDFFKELEADAIDILNTEFVYSKTPNVPSVSDTEFSFDRAVQKSGKEIETCVLYVDIRNSVNLSESMSPEDMGKVYTMFTKGVIKCAAHHNGFIRNIIGDRVMIVFPSENCFTNAVLCGISINHYCNTIMKDKCDGITFECGIGIDYGRMNVIKVGIPKQGSEGYDNKNLAWSGKPANIASRLTDLAKKKGNPSQIEVKYHKRNLFEGLDIGFFGLGGSSRLASRMPRRQEREPKPYFDEVSTEVCSLEEFSNKISKVGDSMLYDSGKYVSHKTIEKKSLPAILMTKEVYDGYAAANSTRKSVIKKYWKEIEYDVKNYNGSLYGSDLFWIL